MASPSPLTPRSVRRASSSAPSPPLWSLTRSRLGTVVDRKRVGRGNAIKSVGAHTVPVNFYRDITAEVTVLVGVTAEAVAEEAAEEAETEQVEAAEETAEVAE